MKLIIPPEVEFVDNLTSTDTDKGLTANQGKTLQDAKVAIASIVDNLTTTTTNVPLSANQGKVLKDAIDTINALLVSDESTLDTLQEVVDYIETNRSTLNALGIANITGLQAALDAKQPNLTFGIGDTNSVKIDGAASLDEYVKFTSSGLKGVSASTLASDLSLSSSLSKSTTPTLSTTGFRVTISNWSSYSSPTVQLTGDGFQPIYTQAGSVLYITNAGIGAHKVYVQITESGKITSDTAAASLTLPTYRFYRMTFEPSASGGGSVINEMKFYSGAGQTGTAYPTNMTSNNAPYPFVASQSGSGISPYLAFDGSTAATGYWGSGNSTDYLQIDMGTNVQILSMKMNLHSSYFPERITVKASRSGAFTGEEIVLLEMAGLNGGADINVG